MQKKILENEEEESIKKHQEDFVKEISAPAKVENFKSRLERLIPEFYIDQKSISDDSDYEEPDKKSIRIDESSDLSELDENAKKNLFERMKTKKNFYIKTQVNNEFVEKKKKINAIGNKDNYNLPYLPTRINFHNSKSKEKACMDLYTESSPRRLGSGLINDINIKNAAASKIYREKHKPKGLFEDDKNILNIKKIREKFDIIKRMEKKKEKIISADLFNYDKKKWEKKNLKEVII